MATNLSINTKGSSINDVTALGGGESQGFCDDSTKTLVIKNVTMCEGGFKIVRNYVTSFMDVPLHFFIQVRQAHSQLQNAKNHLTNAQVQQSLGAQMQELKKEKNSAPKPGKPIEATLLNHRVLKSPLFATLKVKGLKQVNNFLIGNMTI